ncbi:MAG: hypothetical protein JNK29_00890 [Anaerolineales bacterium]|nr:hypothetical protein [Anaerolineales bacterium]
METARVLRLDQPAAYRIVFQGRVEAEWSDWLARLSVDIQPGTPHQPALTTLTGTVADQAALFGLLARLRDLGQPLLLVQCLEAELAPPPSHPGVPHD